MRQFVAMLVLLMSVLLIAISSHAQTEITTTANPETCQPQPLDALELTEAAGEFLYVDSQNRLVSTNRNFINDQPQVALVGGWRISPNGLYLAGSYYEDVSSNIEQVIVLDRSGQRIYSGAPAQANIFDVRWIGNERLVSFVLFSTGRNSSMQRTAGFGYYLIDPFEREYTYFQPPYEPPFWRGSSWYFEGPANLTYDGRYLFLVRTGLYDFETQQPLELQNIEWGIPSYTSHKLLVVEYSSANYIDPVEEDTHPIFVYNFDDDTLTQITTFAPERPVDIYSFPNSWSPDETLWAYALDYDDEIAFRHVALLNLDSRESRPTCFGQFFETGVAPFSGTPFVTSAYPSDFAWSRDSRYLMLSGVLEGHDMQESFGVYIYDTQTEEIYEVYRGSANIAGWMAS